MGELSEPRWAVISERGCEASSLNYEEAARLLHRLDDEKVHGTCIITAEAARHLAPADFEARRNTKRPSKTHSKP